MLFLLRLPVIRHPQDSAEHAVPDLVVQADAHVFFHGHVVKQPDVLERPGDARLVGVNSGHGAHVPPFQHQYRLINAFPIFLFDYFGKKIVSDRKETDKTQ